MVKDYEGKKNEQAATQPEQQIEQMPARFSCPNCPNCGSDETEVYRTVGASRYCKCNSETCKCRFKVTGEAAGETTSHIRLAGECPANAKHESTRVYGEQNGTSFCVCDDCGVTWKKPSNARQKPKSRKVRD